MAGCGCRPSDSTNRPPLQPRRAASQFIICNGLMAPQKPSGIHVVRRERAQISAGANQARCQSVPVPDQCRCQSVSRGVPQIVSLGPEITFSLVLALTDNRGRPFKHRQAARHRGTDTMRTRCAPMMTAARRGGLVPSPILRTRKGAEAQRNRLHGCLRVRCIRPAACIRRQSVRGRCNHGRYIALTFCRAPRGLSNPSFVAEQFAFPLLSLFLPPLLVA